MRFLAARRLNTPLVAIVGAPYDATSTFRRGSRYGTTAIRWASHSIETYSPILQHDLEEVALADFGDLEIADLPPAAAIDAVAARVGALSDQTLPLLLGGEHTVTLGAVRTLKKRHPNLAILQLDAHADLRDAYDGQRLSHATVMRRVLEIVGTGSLVQLGIRAGTKAEFTFARNAAHYTSSRLEIPTQVWNWLESRPVYVTVDIDVVDPSAAPGTGNPEPDGASATELLQLVRRLPLLRLVGFDLVEVSPFHDPSGRTAILAAIMLREAILGVHRARLKARARRRISVPTPERKRGGRFHLRF